MEKQPTRTFTIREGNDSIVAQKANKGKSIIVDVDARGLKSKYAPFMDIDGELLFSVVPALIMVRVLRRFLDLPTRLPRVSQALGWIWVPMAVLFVADQIFRFHTKLLDDGYRLFAYTVGVLVLAALRHYRPARTVLLAALPYVLYLAIELMLTAGGIKLGKKYDDIVNNSEGFALLWLFTFFLIARSQKKTLEKERLEREAEEQERQRIAAQNVELERLVAERTSALTRQAEELRETLTELKTTQAQLVQSEKMASLGELTAGIAHEIQNPLNFVNNFSEVSVELLHELQEGPLQQLPDAEKTYANELLTDLVQNLQKITTHGKRADSIVKGMLEHSRASSGERRPTDLNALADEYLRLSYHGLRAKDKSFNATLTTDFDPGLSPVSVVSQEVGRVLLNMFTNAFYAVQQRQKLGQPGYAPEVRVSTHQRAEEVEIRVRDNGTGMPDSVKAKVFQPFFTTKPTGEGTGLGLSLSHDIIVKGHGGTLQVDSCLGQYTEFIITLPI
ncbi:His Kinase A (phospho-acceptor) domain-containing protein [Hymenobacter daecheongensis DSM 21074]|uniref:histidine kinase n=1 Tax=Hymenobacter daecheongensis DSM 21074 TaxID=1121955 RepID=A0A1M6F6E9_9BACT|nr:ATP-binding protein [Hymenobacter daecheongensis]SHI93243.1 His Kinase A (phospho-acceptor) domain-containing protein [Hymenobacter daecheongensis DSM 21074]